MLAERVVALGRPQHPMPGVHAHAPVLPVDAKAFGQVEGRIVGDRRGADLVGEAPCLQQAWTRASLVIVSEHFSGLSQRV